MLTLSACGGGSSDGGGGGNFAGTYVGSADITVSAGGMSQTFSGAQQLVVAGDDTVSVGLPDNPPVATGQLNGDEFTVNAPAALLNRPGLSCTGTVIITGTIQGDTAAGSVSSSQAACNGVPVTVAGSHSAQRTG